LLINNCFKKKLKFFLSNLSENLANTPILRSTLKAAIDTYLHTQSVQTSLSRGDTMSLSFFNGITIFADSSLYFLSIRLDLIISFIDLPTEQEQDVAEERKTIKGRINSINLDATKNQIGFKVKNEGNEIHCHLSRFLLGKLLGF
jgi:hypothetical protein